MCLMSLCLCSGEASKGASLQFSALQTVLQLLPKFQVTSLAALLNLTAADEQGDETDHLEVLF